VTRPRGKKPLLADKRYPDRLRVEAREEFERRLKRETAKAAKELHRRPVAA
jgi:hypothetical protein